MDANAKQEYCQVLQQRADFYRLLSSLYFKEVTDEFIVTFGELPAPDPSDNALLNEGFTSLAKYLARKGPDPRTDLAVDYARVFLSAGVYEGVSANPYESIYTSEEGLIMQDARDQVRAIYISQGLGVDEAHNLPDDHISFELEFLALMSDKARKFVLEDDGCALEENLQVQHDFICTHLLNWLPCLAEKIDACAGKPFYPAVMRITRGFLEEDRSLLAELLSMQAA